MNNDRYTDISRRAIAEGLAKPYVFHLGVTRDITLLPMGQVVNSQHPVVHVWGERPMGEGSAPLAATSITAAALLEVGRADLAAHCMRQAPKLPSAGLDGEDLRLVQKAMLLGQLGQAANEKRWQDLADTLELLDQMRSPVQRN